jgi:AcrR family transcriptional regulator
VARRSVVLDVAAVLDGFRRGVGSPPEQDDEATAALLDAASTLLSDYGVRRWSMDDVAERAGLGRATVYRRFDNREELVNAAIARDAHRFFGAIAEAVSRVDAIEAKVVEGFLVGLRVVRSSLLPALFETDRAAALAILTSTPVLALGREELVQRYQALEGVTLRDRDRAQVELIAETMVRLALSFLVMPDSCVDLSDDTAARAALSRIIKPLLAGG